MTRNNNTPPVAEQIIIDNPEQTIEELREQIRILQNELGEEKRHANKMDDLVWENWEMKKQMETQKNEEITNLKMEFTKEKSRADNLQKELEKEKGWWDKWFDSSIEKYLRISEEAVARIKKDKCFWEKAKKTSSEKDLDLRDWSWRADKISLEGSQLGGILYYVKEEVENPIVEIFFWKKMIKEIYKYYRDY